MTVAKVWQSILALPVLISAPPDSLFDGNYTWVRPPHRRETRQRRHQDNHGMLNSKSKLAQLIAPAFVCYGSLHMLETNPFLRVRLLKQSAYAGSKQITLTYSQRQSSSQYCNQLAHHNLSWNLPLASISLPEITMTLYKRKMKKNEDKIDGKDKWVKRWEHFQFTIGVPDNDLGQVGL